MRVLCVGRHQFLSEHLCRVFSDADAECEPVVGVTEAMSRAADFEPHVVVSDYDLITPALMESWMSEPALKEVPVLAVSLTRRPEDTSPTDFYGLAAVVYLPSLQAGQAKTLLAGLHRPRGVLAPRSWRSVEPASSVHR